MPYFKTMVASFAGLALLASSAQTATRFLESCIGCQVLAASEGYDSGSSTTGCDVTLWREVSGFSETCGDAGVDCRAAECQYNWKVYYRTEGMCTVAFVWTVNDETMESPLGSTGGEDVSIDAGTYGLKSCGRSQPWSYSITQIGDALSSASIAGDDGCAECENPVGG